MLLEKEVELRQRNEYERRIKIENATVEGRSCVFACFFYKLRSLITFY